MPTSKDLTLECTYTCTDTQDHFSKSWIGSTFYLNFVMCFKPYLTTYLKHIKQYRNSSFFFLPYASWYQHILVCVNVSYPELTRYQSSVCLVHMTNTSEWLYVYGTALLGSSVHCYWNQWKLLCSRLKIQVRVFSTWLMTMVSQHQINSYMYFNVS